jgi:flotillin
MSANLFWIIVGVVGLVIFFFLFISFLASLYQKAGPNEVLIVSGRRYGFVDETGKRLRRGYKIVAGGGTFVIPMFEKVNRMSLENITLDIVTPEFYTKLGVPIVVEGVAQIKVKSDDVSIATAAEQFLTKTLEEIKSIAYQTVSGHLRAILGTMTVEEVMTGHEAFAQRVQEVSAGDLTNMGLTVVSFTIRNISDSHGYLDALGKPQIAQVRKNATIGEAEANRDATIKSADANRQGQIAKLAADTVIAEADRDYKMKLADFNASVQQKKAESDLAYDLQKFKTQQSVTAEEVQVEVIRKQREIDVAAQEAMRKEKELVATVTRPAEAERSRQAVLADGEGIRLKTVAQGQAEAVREVGVGEADAARAKGLAQAEVIKAQGLAQADVQRAQGLAQAEVIKAQAMAEAEGMQARAEAWKQYNEAAIAQMFIDKLPDIVSALAAPLAKVDRIVLVNTGSGDGTGLTKLTGDMTQIIAQVPPVLEALTGMKFDELVKHVPGMSGAASHTPPETPASEQVVDAEK